MNKILQSDPKIRLFHSEKFLKDWAIDKTKKEKILFIDEANLSSRQWSEFEGLFNNPPTILIDGELYPLSPTHKVIFAGNPLSYGDERSLASLFERHGRAILFQPLSSAVIYEDILKPISEDKTLAEPILEIYQFFCRHAKTDVLITPRELQMMALMTVAYMKKYPEASIKEVAQYYSYHVAKNWVPEGLETEFNERFKYSVALLNDDQHLDDYLITKSRENIYQHIKDFLNLSVFKQKYAHNEETRFGGLCAITLEGEPGIGKSELVTQILLMEGYTERKKTIQSNTYWHYFCELLSNFISFFLSWNKDPSINKQFYRIPVCMPTEEKASLLLQAFNEGAVVVIDEINSSPMMERLLNSLLMGKTLENKRPKKPGFLIIGTQNPVSYAGRRVTSSALMHRTMTARLDEYSTQEIEQILVSKGLDGKKAQAMTKAFETQREYAISNNLKPVPVFRDLLKLLKQELKLQLNNDDFLYNAFISSFRKKYGKIDHPEMKVLISQLDLLTANKNLNAYQKIERCQSLLTVIDDKKSNTRFWFLSKDSSKEIQDYNVWVRKTGMIREKMAQIAPQKEVGSHCLRSLSIQPE